jgi:hypothetical protein
MPIFTETIANFRRLAAAREVTASLVVSVVGEQVALKLESGAVSHADQHMRNEGVFGHTTTRDDHLHGEWKDRLAGHGMFSSPEDSVLAIAAALNTAAGADALGELQGRPGGINLYSRTAAGLIASAFERRREQETTRFHEFRVDHVVVSLLDAKFVQGPEELAPGVLVIASAYPVAQGGPGGMPDQDWWSFNEGGDGAPKAFPREPEPIAPW